MAKLIFTKAKRTTLQSSKGWSRWWCHLPPPSASLPSGTTPQVRTREVAVHAACKSGTNALTPLGFVVSARSGFVTVGRVLAIASSRHKNRCKSFLSYSHLSHYPHQTSFYTGTSHFTLLFCVINLSYVTSVSDEAFFIHIPSPQQALTYTAPSCSM